MDHILGVTKLDLGRADGSSKELARRKMVQKQHSRSHQLQLHLTNRSLHSPSVDNRQRHIRLTPLQQPSGQERYAAR